MNKEYRISSCHSRSNSAIKLGMPARKYTVGARSLLAGVSIAIGCVSLALFPGISLAQSSYYGVNDGGTQQGNYANDGATGTNAIAAGVGALASGQEAVAIGTYNTAAGDFAVAIGYTNTANGVDSSAVGNFNLADGDRSNAFGLGNNVFGADANAFGSENFVDADGSLAIGNGNSIFTGAVGGLVLGNGGSVSAADAIAVGNNATAGATDAIALGTGANASTANSVALGAGATTSAAVSSAGGVIAGDSYTFAGDAPVGTVSIGAATAERTLTNLAAGRIGANSTDAVNGSQLHATNQAVEKLDTRVTTLESSIVNVGGVINNFDDRLTDVEDGVNNIQKGGVGAFQVSQDVAMIDPQAAGSNSAAGGNGAKASGANALAIGNQSQAAAADSTALGTGAVAGHANSVALGAGSSTVRGAETAYNAAYVGGSDSTGEVNIGNRTVTGVAPGTAGTDAANVDQLKGGVSYAVDQSRAYTDSRLQKLDNDLWALDRDYRAATASAMAMAGLPQAYLPGKSMLAMGFGGYRSEYGMAVGLSGITESGRLVYKAQASGNTARDWGFSMGAGVQW